LANEKCPRCAGRLAGFSRVAATKRRFLPPASGRHRNQRFRKKTEAMLEVFIIMIQTT